MDFDAELGDANLTERHGGSMPQRVWNLGDAIDLSGERLQITVSTQLNVVGDRPGNGRITEEFAVNGDANGIEFHAEARRFAEKVIRNTASDRKVEELTAVEAFSAATRLYRPVDDQCERPGGANGGYLPGDGARLDGEQPAEDIIQLDRSNQ